MISEEASAQEIKHFELNPLDSPIRKSVGVHFESHHQSKHDSVSNFMHDLVEEAAPILEESPRREAT